jgi:hypothetical protein
MIFYVPTETREAHANISPRYLSNKINNKLNYCYMTEYYFHSRYISIDVFQNRFIMARKIIEIPWRIEIFLDIDNNNNHLKELH